MNLPSVDMRAAAAWFLAAVFFVSALTLMLWVVMDWYEDRSICTGCGHPKHDPWRCTIPDGRDPLDICECPRGKE